MNSWNVNGPVGHRPKIGHRRERMGVAHRKEDEDRAQTEDSTQEREDEHEHRTQERGDEGRAQTEDRRHGRARMRMREDPG